MSILSVSYRLPDFRDNEPEMRVQRWKSKAFWAHTVPCNSQSGYWPSGCRGCPLTRAHLHQKPSERKGENSHGVITGTEGNRGLPAKGRADQYLPAERGRALENPSAHAPRSWHTMFVHLPHGGLFLGNTFKLISLKWLFTSPVTNEFLASGHITSKFFMDIE